jgi:hypothetical protein
MKNSRYLLILKLNLVLLTGLIFLAFLLPLSSSERWILVLTEAVLIGLTWALISYAKKG